jgi:hypothetical protein
MKDEFDSMEFKPITEGLGFHKKTLNLGEDFNTKPVSPTDGWAAQPPALGKLDIKESKKPSFLERAQALYTRGSDQESVRTTPRVDIKSAPQNAPPPQKAAATPRAEIFSPASGGVTQAVQGGWRSQTFQQPVVAPQTVVPKTGLEARGVSLGAVGFDALFVLGLTLLFAAVVFALTGIDSSTLWNMLQNDSGSLVASYLLVVAVYGTYSVACRTFFWQNPGRVDVSTPLGHTRATRELSLSGAGGPARSARGIHRFYFSAAAVFSF